MAKKSEASRPVRKPAAKAPAKKPAPARTAPVRAADPAVLKALQKTVEHEFKNCRKNEISLGRRIDEVGAAGVKIVNEIELLRKDVAPAQAKVAAERLAKAEKAILELKAAAEALRKQVACLSSETGLCNAKPLEESFKNVDRKVSGFSADVETLRKAVREIGEAMGAKVDEIAAKFNLHSHFLLAKNWSQDLLFHLEPSVGVDKSSPLPDSNKPLMTKPARSTREPAPFAIELRLTPPRHWDDPVIWFDNIGPVEPEKTEPTAKK